MAKLHAYNGQLLHEASSAVTRRELNSAVTYCKDEYGSYVAFDDQDRLIVGFDTVKEVMSAYPDAVEKEHNFTWAAYFDSSVDNS